LASWRILSGCLYFGVSKASRWMTAESTLGFGEKCFAGTPNARCGFAYSWVWIERIDCLRFGCDGVWAQIFSATSFWTRSVRDFGGFALVRKWVIRGDVM